MAFAQSDGEKVIAEHLLSSIAELMAGRHALSGHFSFQERFFCRQAMCPYSQAAENAAMAVLVACCWHRGTWLMRRAELADVDRLMPSRRSSWL